jgi:hypothetical protein
MSASNPYLQRALRFCEVCGMYVGNLTKKDWDRAGHFCKECDDAYPGLMMINPAAIKKEWGVHT